MKTPIKQIEKELEGSIDNPEAYGLLSDMLDVEIKQEKKKRKSGGGRKPKYGEPTTTTAFRIPESYKAELRAYVKSELKKKEVI